VAAPAATQQGSVPFEVVPYGVLQPGEGRIPASKYLRSIPETSMWGRLPSADDAPVAVIDNGDVITVDTLSHEGILEDQGRNPDEYFAQYGVAPKGVLDDLRAIAASDMAHDFDDDGPHVVTGPIAVRGAKPGDMLAITVLELQPRVPYGLVSSRHGFGALPDDVMPDDGPVCVFATGGTGGGAEWGEMAFDPNRGPIRFPLRPFLGIMGLTVDSTQRPHSVPPGPFGGNIDISLLGVGSTFYIPVQVPDAMAYFGDPHFAQGDGEIALTAFEASLRATVKLDVIPAADAAKLAGPEPRHLFAKTDELLIPVGLDEDLDEAMRNCVRNALALLTTQYGLPRHIARAYLSAAGDFAVSQVVDATKGIHGKIRIADFVNL
jgi:acetamidase/formamidase